MFLSVCILLVLSSADAKVQSFHLDADSRPHCPCGNRNSPLKTRVVGGHKAGIGVFPYASGLQYATSEGRIRAPYCGATLVSDSHVVTAAHCVKSRSANEILVDVGDYDILHPSINQSIKVKSIIKFPNYVPGIFHFDIALIELETPVTWGPGLRASVLPPPGLELEEGTTVSVYGWGRLEYKGRHPNILRSVELPVIDNDICQEKFKTLIMDNMLCAGGQKGRDACIGDSGSGLVVRLGNEYVLCGVVSFGRQCALPNVAGVYTRVSYYTNWIMRNTRSSRCKPCIYR